MASNLILEHLAVFSKNCLKCKHLVPSAKKKYNSCHFSKGNTHCPAQEVRIVIVGRAILYAEKVAKARKEHNTLLEVELLKKVSLLSPRTQANFYRHLEKL